MFYMSYLTMSSFRADSMGLHAKIQKGKKSLKHVPSNFFLGRSSCDLQIKGNKSYFVCVERL